jgi:hypothetical protein
MYNENVCASAAKDKIVELTDNGDNLGNVVQFMQREHPKRFQSISTKIA